MNTHEWMFDVLGELSLQADKAGYVVLAEALLLCMDAFELDERRLGHQVVLQTALDQNKSDRVERSEQYLLTSSDVVQEGPASMCLLDHIAQDKVPLRAKTSVEYEVGSGAPVIRFRRAG